MTFRLNLSKLALAAERLGAGAEEGVRLGAEHVLTEANLHVPHDEGTLERSGAVDTDGTKAAISYDTPYAVRQHEDLQLSHGGKGQAKWLEAALAAEADTVGKIIAQAIKGQVGTL